MSDSATIAITTVVFILVIVDIVGNTLVCAIIKRNRAMRIPINFLLVNLAVADIMYATFIVPKIFNELTAVNHPDGVTGRVLCKLLTDGMVAWVAGASSFFTLVAVAIERYYAVVYPLGNKWKLTKAKLKVIISSSWVFALMLHIPYVLAVDTKKVKDKNLCVYVWPEDWMGKLYSWTLFIFQTVIPLILMIGLYSRVVHTLWFKRNENSLLTHQQRGFLRVRKRVTLMVLTVTTIFGVCWGAESVEYILRQFPSINTSQAVVSIVDTMVLFNSAVNPFVYALLNQQFREKMKKMICCADSSEPRIQPTPEQQDKELADNSTHPTPTAGSCSTK